MAHDATFVAGIRQVRDDVLGLICDGNMLRSEISDQRWHQFDFKGHSCLECGQQPSGLLRIVEHQRTPSTIEPSDSASIPRITNDGAAKAYVHSLGEALHYEFKPLGVYVTVLATGFTNTPVLEKFRFDPKTMPMKPMSVEQCVSEGLSGLIKNRSRVVPGRLNRIMNALVPASLARKMEADMIDKGLASKSAGARA